MQVAPILLRKRRAPIVLIALEVGYESKAAFTRAFKRLVGYHLGYGGKIRAESL
jgi:AraC-like DNA-binding protein